MAPKGKAKAKPKSAGPAAKGKAKAKAKAGAQPEQAEPPSPEELAVMCWQAEARGYLARRLLGQLLAKQKQQEAEVAEAIRAAGAAALKLERRQMEVKAAKDAAKKAKARKFAEDRTILLTAAFDGEPAQVSKLLAGGLPVDSKDANGSTALSEAASGGSAETVSLLLDRKGDPNSRGEFQRTPLWRATYAGHLEVARILLEGGSDPRLYDSQGQTPVDITSVDGITEMLRGWDLARTDELVEDYNGWLDDIRSEEDFRCKQAMRDVEAEYEQAKKAHEAAQGVLARAKAAMRARVKEHGLGLAAGSDEAKMACASADAELQKVEGIAFAAQIRYDKANVARLAAAEECGAATEQLGRVVQITDLNNVLLRDIGGQIGSSSKWPLLIDASDCARKLLTYAGCSVLNFWRAEEISPRALRLALLSMIRGGGVLAIDLALFGAGVDRDLFAEPFTQVRPWLFTELTERDAGHTKLLSVQAKQTWPRYQELVEKDEKKAFGIENFDEERTAKFKFMVLTSADPPHKDLLSMFDVLRVGATG